MECGFDKLAWVQLLILKMAAHPVVLRFVKRHFFVDVKELKLILLLLDELDVRQDNLAINLIELKPNRHLVRSFNQVNDWFLFRLLQVRSYVHT